MSWRCTCLLLMAWAAVMPDCAARLIGPTERPYKIRPVQTSASVPKIVKDSPADPWRPTTTLQQRSSGAVAWAGGTPGALNSVFKGTADLPPPAHSPAWMDEYAAFHAQQRGQPGARYLIHSVRLGRSGLGDRIRGMLFSTRLAASSKRVILFTWKGDPDEPQAFFAPAGSIDWRLEGTGYQEEILQSSAHTNSLELDMYNWMPEQQETLQKVKQGFLQTLQDKQYVTIFTNERGESDCAGCPPLDGPMRVQDSGGGIDSGQYSAACLFRMLFTPSAALEEAASQQLEQLFGPGSQAPGFHYVAAHLRLGGLGHEGRLKKDRGTGKGELADVIGALSCAQKLGQGVGLNTNEVPVLLITDNHMLRSFVLSGGLAHAVTPNFLPIHMARLDDQEKAGHAAMATFIDLMLLARAECFVGSDSGFSETAWMLGGGKSCLGRLDKHKGVCGTDKLPPSKL